MRYARTVSCNLRNLSFNIILLSFLLISSSTYGQISRDSLFVFTGKKISIKKVRDFVDNETLIDSIVVNDSVVYVEIPNVIQDYKYKGRFKIIDQFEGNLKEKEIEFVLYNHYGKPKLQKSNIYLLFVIKINGEYQLLRYAHHRVYETTNGEYAIPYDVSEYQSQKTPLKNIHAEKLNFKETPSYRIYNGDSEDWIHNTFPKPYYQIEKRKAIPLYGNYIEDYIKLRLNGTLKEVFDN